MEHNLVRPWIFYLGSYTVCLYQLLHGQSKKYRENLDGRRAMFQHFYISNEPMFAKTTNFDIDWYEGYKWS